MNVAGEGLQELYGRSWGYISGSDLSMWCDPQLIISALDRNPKSVQKAVNAAIAMISSALQNIYDLKPEYMKSDSVPAQLSAEITTGEISKVNILAAGSNYSAAPAIAIGPSDKGAALTAVVSPSVIIGVDVLEPGCRYKTAPVVSFEDGGGNGAVAVATIDTLGRVTKITVTNGGQGWTSIPTVRITSADGYGTGAEAVAYVQYGKITGVNIDDAGAGFTEVPTLTVTDGQVDDPRNAKLVTLTSIWTVRVLLGNAGGIGEVTQAAFKMCDDLLHEMKAGGGGLPLLSANRRLSSTAKLVKDKYNTLG